MSLLARLLRVEPPSRDAMRVLIRSEFVSLLAAQDGDRKAGVAGGVWTESKHAPSVTPVDYATKPGVSGG